jgi:putative ABC transport system permease protein
MNMRTLAVRSVRQYPVRFVATVLAVLVGTAFLAGTLVLRDSLSTSLQANVNSGLQGVDAAVLNPLGSPAAGAGATTGGVGTATGGPAAGGTAPGTTAVAQGGSTAAASPGGRGGPRGRAESGGGPTQRGSATGETQTPGVNLHVPASLLPTVQRAEGVRDAAGVLTGLVNVVDASGSSVADNATGALWVSVPELNAYTITSGRAPAAHDEVAMDQRTVDKAGLHLGDTVHLATTAGPQTPTLVGIAHYGAQGSSSGSGDVLVDQADAFAWLNNGVTEYSAIYASARDGVSPDTLVANITAAVGPDFQVETGDQLRDAVSEGATGFADVIGTGLEIFAFVALFVSIFIIYNTFSIIVAQRTREFALLRAIGASGTQVRRSVFVEALVVGFGASVLGYLVGLLLFEVITRLVPQFQDIAGSVALTIRFGGLALVLIVGTLITVLSAVVPAFRAARTRPIEAMRAVSIDRSGTSRVRAVLGLALLAIGVGVLLAGAAATNFWAILFGLLPLFIGVLIGGPVLAAAFGWLIDKAVRPFGRTPLRLGAENVRRNPSRSATTANALIIGVFLVVLVTAAGGAVRDFATDQLSKLGGPDFTVYTTASAFPPGYVDAVRKVDGVTSVSELYPNAGTLPTVSGRGGGGGRLTVSGVDFANTSALGLSFESGSFEGLGDNDVVIPSIATRQTKLAIGDPIDVAFNDGTTRTMRVGAIAKTSLSFSGFVSANVVRQVDPALSPGQLDIAVGPGKTQAVQDGLDNLSKGYSSVFVLPGNFIAEFVKAFFNFLISAVSALLSIAVVIALFGIINTLVLSITERTREIGLLRAVGMTTAQLRGTIRLESLVVALLGSVVGIVSGLFVSWCLTRPIIAQGGAGFSWPVTQMLVILLLGVVIGIVASLIPAWRATRLDVLEAVTVE